MIEAYTLFSGSSGNSLLVRSGSTAVLVDAGRSRRAVSLALAQLDLSIADIAAVFVTHEHTDHISALTQITKHEHLPVHAAAGTADYLTACVSGECTVAHPPCFTERVGDLEITSFPLPHDSLCHVGYCFRDSDGDGFCAATDMGHVTDAVIGALEGCRGALLESNHAPDMLRFGPYPAALKSRILAPTGHLSNEDCASLAMKAAMRGVRYIGLGHLSPENNTPEKARASAEKCLAGTGVEVVVCARDALTRIM